MAARRKDGDLAALAAHAERAKLDGDPSGFISGGFIYSDFSIILGGCVDFHDEIPESVRKRIATKVALGSDLPRPITAEGLLAACSKHESEYLKQPKKPFRLLTEVSLWWTIDLPRITVAGVSLTFKPKLAKEFSHRAALARESQNTLGFELPTSYMRLSAYVKARSPEEAAERALDAIDLVRASWNLALNRSKTWRFSGGRPPPVNDIRLSPFHTVHDSSGDLATQTFWYDPGYSKSASLFSDKAKFVKVLAFASNLRARLRALKYRADIEGALIRYVRALDAADLNDAFLRLWSLLEYLTDSTHDPYKVATRRAAFLFSDRTRSQLILSHLTNHRNRFVHVGSEAEDIESLVFQLKRYVDQLLLFHLGTRFRFDSRADAARFMDLPPDQAELSLRLHRLQQAKKFVSGGA